MYKRIAYSVTVPLKHLEVVAVVEVDNHASAVITATYSFSDVVK